MRQFTDNKKTINKEIQFIESEEDNLLSKSIKIIGLLEDAFDKLKKFISRYTFKSSSVEILFFKEKKPQIFSQLIYYRKVYNLEMRMPTGSRVDKKEYLESVLGRIKYFFDLNSDF